MDPELDAYRESAFDDFDYEGIILRRADPDDTQQIIDLVEIGKDDTYNRVYSYPRILKLIESAYLALSVLDRGGNVLAFAAFEDFPQGLRGMQDDRHYNYWEAFFSKAYKVEDFSSLNTLWLTYFNSGGSIAYKEQKFVFKRILQTVYTSLPEIIGVLFLARGDADEEDINYCFDPVSVYFEEVELKEPAALANVRGIDPSSRVYFSSRVLMLPFIEIRPAQQEDHDDLADVFNNQSETVTEAYGEYFLAELIAAQSENNKALVAQVKDKAVGLMGLTNEVDTSLLHQCFELDPYDNLLKPEYMDAIKKRREYLQWEAQVQAEQERIQFLKEMKQETMKCNIIAQRISLQEYMRGKKSEDVIEEIEEWTLDEEKVKTLTRQHFEDMLDKWCEDFVIEQPSQFLRDHPTNDAELVCSIQNGKEFLLQTLRFFGLPKGYLEGEGHFPDWGKKRAEDKRRGPKQKKKEKKQSKAISMYKKKIGKVKNDDSDIKPTHFDISVFLKCFKKFVACDGEQRSNARRLLLKDLNKAAEVCLDEHADLSYKKVVDVYELPHLLQKKGEHVEQTLLENLGAILMCFGEIEHELQYGERIPPETEEERRARIIAEMKQKEKEDAKKEAEANGEKFNEEDFKVPVIEPK